MPISITDLSKSFSFLLTISLIVFVSILGYKYCILSIEFESVLNGLIYSYIEGRTISIGDLIDIKTFNQTAISISNLHKLNPPSIKKVPTLFITLRK